MQVIGHEAIGEHGAVLTFLFSAQGVQYHSIQVVSHEWRLVHKSPNGHEIHAVGAGIELGIKPLVVRRTIWFGPRHSLPPISFVPLCPLCPPTNAHA